MLSAAVKQHLKKSMICISIDVGKGEYKTTAVKSAPPLLCHSVDCYNQLVAAATTEQAQQEQEQVDEVEVQDQRTIDA